MANPMITDVDTCLKDIADWYIKNRREMTEPELESILLKHCESKAEVQKFVKFLETEPGQLRFKTLLRERKGGKLEVGSPSYLKEALRDKALSGWILNFLKERADSAFSTSNLQLAILKADYPAPSIKEIETAVQGLVSGGLILKPSPYLYKYEEED